MAFANEQTFRSRVEKAIAELRSRKVFQLPAIQRRIPKISTSSVNGKIIITVDGKQQVEIPHLPQAVAVAPTPTPPVEIPLPSQAMSPTPSPTQAPIPIVSETPPVITTSPQAIAPVPSIVTLPQPISEPTAIVATSPTGESNVVGIIHPENALPTSSTPLIQEAAGFTFPKEIFGIKSGYILAGAALLFLLMRGDR